MTIMRETNCRLPIVNYSLSIVNYKDMEVPINDFDDIRPLNNDEVKDAIESLIANEDFERAFPVYKAGCGLERVFRNHAFLQD